MQRKLPSPQPRLPCKQRVLGNSLESRGELCLKLLLEIEPTQLVYLRSPNLCWSLLDRVARHMTVSQCTPALRTCNEPVDLAYSPRATSRALLGIHLTAAKNIRSGRATMKRKAEAQVCLHDIQIRRYTSQHEESSTSFSPGAV